MSHSTLATASIAPVLPTKAASTGLFWALVPVVLLGSLVLGLGAIVVFYVNDPSLALEDDYYKKAVGWDQHQARERSNLVLGYKLQVDPQPLSRGAKSFELRVVPRDRSGALLTQASVEVEAFPNAEASRIFRGKLTPRAGGVLVVDVPRVRTGLWEFRIALENGKERYTEVVRRDVVSGP